MTNKQTRNVFQNSAANPLPTAFCDRKIPLTTAPKNGVKELIGNEFFLPRAGFAGLGRIFSLPAGKAIRGQP
jgi:hypothetical protein